MKPIVVIILALFMNNGCPQKKQEMQAPSSITYQAMTRGSSYECTVTRDSIVTESSGLTKDRISSKLKPEDWTGITELMKNIDLSSIESLESPSSDRYSDRSAIGSLQIVTDGNVYKSASFDDQNPPTELKALVDKILALAETVE